MPWTSMHWTIVCLLCAIAVLVLVVIHQADRAARAESALNKQPTRRRRRAWKAQQLELPKAVANRRRW